MKPVFTIAALALMSLSASAQEATLFKDNFVGARSRADVHAETVAAIARGDGPLYGEARGLERRLRTASNLTRAEVRAEVLAAQARGERLNWGEASPYPSGDARRGAGHGQPLAVGRSGTAAY